MLEILFAFILLGGLCAVFGVMLSVADKKFAVETDERVSKVRGFLGGVNCGVCGAAGCDVFAQRVAAGELDPGMCPAADVEAIGEILQIKVTSGEKKVARVICQGIEGIAKERYEYDGYESCIIASAMAGGPKLCMFACVGLGDCVRACAFGAVRVENGVAKINAAKCVGCGVCVAKCPRNVIRLAERDERVMVLCRNGEEGRTARAQCMKACIACGRCVKECKYDAIFVSNGFAKIDVEKCTRCGDCIGVCPCGCIVEN